MADNSAYPSQDDVKQRVIAAICMLYQQDRDLLKVGANERSITHKLAEYLQPKFPTWNVDCEYNRCGDLPKQLSINSWSLRPDDTEAKTIFPDIIIHRRLTRKNLLVIEIKKTKGHEDTKDIAKLKAFTETKEYSYNYGFFLRLGKDGCAAFEIYQDGARHADWTEDLKRALKDFGYGG
jgi:hypothetical protein